MLFRRFTLVSMPVMSFLAGCADDVAPSAAAVEPSAERVSPAPVSPASVSSASGALFGLGDTSLTGLNERGSYPRVATNTRGDAIVVWAARPAFGNGAPTIEYVYRPARGRFTTPRTLATLDVAAVFPNVRLNDAGDAVVAWPSITQSGVYAAVGSPSRGTWSSPVKISRDDQGRFTAQDLVSLALDAEGNAVAAYGQLVASYSVRYDAETRAWGTPIVLPEGADTKSLTLLATGDAFVQASTWTSDSSQGPTWRAPMFRLPNGAAAWQEWQTLGDDFIPRWSSPDCGGRVVAFGSTADVALSGTRFALRAVDSAGGVATYPLPTVVERREGTGQHEETAACEPNGDVTVLYTGTTGPEGRASRYVAAATWSAATGQWSSPETLAEGGIALALRVSPGGKMAAWWLRPARGSQPFEVRFRSPRGLWGRATALSSFFAWDNTGEFANGDELVVTWQRSFDAVGITGGKLFAKVVAAE